MWALWAFLVLNSEQIRNLTTFHLKKPHLPQNRPSWFIEIKPLIEKEAGDAGTEGFAPTEPGFGTNRAIREKKRSPGSLLYSRQNNHGGSRTRPNRAWYRHRGFKEWPAHKG